MDPLLAFAADFWWLGPAVIAGGGATWFGVRQQRRARARTLEYTAAKHELEAARVRVRSARAEVKRTQAELLLVRSARQTRQASPRDVDAANRRVAEAQRHLRAAQTAMKGWRAHVQAARAMLRGTPRGDEHLPLARLMAAHDQVVARWIQYETDPAKAIAFPTMTDARTPATAALLTAMDHARWLRPDSPQAAVTPEEYSRYRAAVAEFAAAFEAAEAAAWRAAGARHPADAGAGHPVVPTEVRERWDAWMRAARTTLGTAVSSAATAATEAARDAMSRAGSRRDDAAPPSTTPPAGTTPPGTTPPSTTPPSTAPPKTTPPPRPADETQADAPPRRRVWPVPRRSAD